MLPIVTPAEMREIDASAPEPVEVLIERAGRRLARAARQMLGGVYGRRVSVIAGPGNNGADAMVAARVLAAAAVRTMVVGPGEPLPACHLVIDGAFGTGMNRDFEAPECPPGAQVLAVDIPSGIDGLTGAARGSALSAQRTVTFAALKPGLLLEPGSSHCGDIEVAAIGLDVRSARSWFFTAQDAAVRIPIRPTAAHKWSQAVLVVGGSAGMAGAPMLAGAGALRAGAGYVRCSLPAMSAPFGGNEIVFEALAESNWGGQALRDIERFHALVIGPGLDSAGEQELRLVLDRAPATTPIVVDGTALRMLGVRPRLRPNVVLTPHDGEFAALAGKPVGADRFEAARSLAASSNSTVLLKGPLTIVATPDGRCVASAHGDARLATAGSGDVLSGILGSMLAAGLEPIDAAPLAAWLHADAARQGPAGGLIASDLIAGVAGSLSALTRSRSEANHAAH